MPAGMQALLSLPGVGPKTAERLAAHGISTPLELLRLLPIRYDDTRTTTPIREIRAGDRVVCQGAVVYVRLQGRPWKRSLEVRIAEGGFEISAIWFSNRRPQESAYIKGDSVLLSGLVTEHKGRLQMAFPRICFSAHPTPRFGRINPVYRQLTGISASIVDDAIAAAAEQTETLLCDPVPRAILEKRKLPGLAEAFRHIHLPSNTLTIDELESHVNGVSPAMRRINYDTFFRSQAVLTTRRRKLKGTPAKPAPKVAALAKKTADQLGFVPTAAQQRVIEEISSDMARPTPMQRLLQGDVGSGKTLVALAAIRQMVTAGYQVALMAPTEILAEQHFRTLAPALGKLEISTALVTGSATATRRRVIGGLLSGDTMLAIGTHALLTASLELPKLGLVIVDEQHRFGVSQRLELRGKGPTGVAPHLLVMTATPIPRTLALAVHGNLDMSFIDTLPPGRHSVKTVLHPKRERRQVLDTLKHALDRGEQAYYICPLVEQSASKGDVADAVSVHRELQLRFNEFEVGILHGKMSSDEKRDIMHAFSGGTLNLLVSTTIVQVGMDVKNATLMVIEDADRFGLSELHQLRGRVGRGNLDSECHLIANAKTEDAQRRLAVMASTDDGLKIAEADLAIRGPGALFGLKQSGFGGLSYTQFLKNTELLEAARRDVDALFESDPTLTEPEHRCLKEMLDSEMTCTIVAIGEEAG